MCLLFLLLLFYYFCFVLGIEPRPFHILGTCCTTEQYHQIYQTSIKMGFAARLGQVRLGEGKMNGDVERVQGEMAGIGDLFGGVWKSSSEETSWNVR